MKEQQPTLTPWQRGSDMTAPTKMTGCLACKAAVTAMTGQQAATTLADRACNSMQHDPNPPAAPPQVNSWQDYHS
jgi:hypothetical protein